MSTISEWAKSEGFTQFIQDHSTVIRNLEAWLGAENEKTEMRIGELETGIQELIDDADLNDHAMVIAKRLISGDSDQYLYVLRKYREYEKALDLIGHTVEKALR